MKIQCIFHDNTVVLAKAEMVEKQVMSRKTAKSRHRSSMHTYASQPGLGYQAIYKKIDC